MSFMWPEDRWEPHVVETVLTNGPERIYDDEGKGNASRPVGFIVERDPLVWEGDQG